MIEAIAPFIPSPVIFANAVAVIRYLETSKVFPFVSLTLDFSFSNPFKILIPSFQPCLFHFLPHPFPPSSSALIWNKDRLRENPVRFLCSRKSARGMNVTRHLGTLCLVLLWVYYTPFPPSIRAIQSGVSFITNSRFFVHPYGRIMMSPFPSEEPFLGKQAENSKRGKICRSCSAMTSGGSRYRSKKCRRLKDPY